MGRRSVVVLVLLAFACASPGTEQASRRLVVTPAPTLEPTPAPTPAPTPEPTPAPTPSPVRAPAARAAAPAPGSSDLAAFHGLGAWVDVFDHTEQPDRLRAMVRDMAAKQVRTLYIETARYDTAGAFRWPASVAAALEEAHAAGMRVVAWYPPDFANVDADLDRSLRAVRYVSPNGHRFDAFAADIEYTAGVPDHAERNARALDYSRRLREGAGDGYPLAIIVIPPTSLERNPSRWVAFPWIEMAASYDVFMPMNYWTARRADPATAAELTRRNTTETRRLSGGRPVHVIGGLAEHVDEAQANAYVDAALETGSLGGGLYDYATTTRPELWGPLRRLNR